jgi:hypothetical protein
MGLVTTHSPDSGDKEEAAYHSGQADCHYCTLRTNACMHACENDMRTHEVFSRIGYRMSGVSGVHLTDFRTHFPSRADLDTSFDTRAYRHAAACRA